MAQRTPLLRLSPLQRRSPLPRPNPTQETMPPLPNKVARIKRVPRTASDLDRA